MVLDPILFNIGGLKKESEGRTSTHTKNYIIFMRFLRKIGQIVDFGWHSLKGWHPTMGNPESTTGHVV